MEAITIEVDEDGTIRLPKSFVAAEPGARVVVRRDVNGRIEIRRIPTISHEEWISQYEIDKTMTWERAVKEGQDIAAREAMGEGES